MSSSVAAAALGFVSAVALPEKATGECMWAEVAHGVQPASANLCKIDFNGVNVLIVVVVVVVRRGEVTCCEHAQL